MLRWLVLIFIFINGMVAGQDELPNVYEYYTEGGIQKGLEALSEGFQLNGKNIVIQSGAMHYFRVHPKYWQHRLKMLRATGLIAVETYVPWNLHEPEKGVFDFGNGGRDMSLFLDLVTFIKMAQQEDLLVLLRPGPYICAEWDMGGLPSWLLRFANIKMRTSEENYLNRVKIYFDQLLPLIKDLQFTKGGPIIAVQLENEYSSVGYNEGPDKEYLQFLKSLMINNSIEELLYTSDNFMGEGSIPGVLRTINFQSSPKDNLNALKSTQPDKPAMVMEFWTGWFDHWTEPSARLGFQPDDYRANLETIMSYPASFNLYMFHGGTNWGFLNGANGDNGPGTGFDVTSYDYFAPLTESGDITTKYNYTMDLVAKYQPVKFKKHLVPDSVYKMAYPAAKVEDYLDLTAIYDAAGSAISSRTLVSMEDLPEINNGNGQSFGFVWYRKSGIDLKAGDMLKITGSVHDVAQVFVDGKLQTKVLESTDDLSGFGFWKAQNAELRLSDSGSTLDILVENLGRVNFGTYTYASKKGLYDGPLLINGAEITDWQIKPLQFNKEWIQSLNALEWKKYNASGETAPGLYKAVLIVGDIVTDTFLDLFGWKKGVVFVNGFNLGRFNFLGPQKRLYLPGPLLKQGSNEILIFEQFVPGAEVGFYDKPDLGNV